MTRTGIEVRLPAVLRAKPAAPAYGKPLTPRAEGLGWRRHASLRRSKGVRERQPHGAEPRPRRDGAVRRFAGLERSGHLDLEQPAGVALESAAFALSFHELETLQPSRNWTTTVGNVRFPAQVAVFYR